MARKKPAKKPDSAARPGRPILVGIASAHAQGWQEPARIDAATARDIAAFDAALDNMARVNEVDTFLYAYYSDRNPVHLLRAVRRVAEDGIPLPEAVLGYLDRAIYDIEHPRQRAGKPPKRNALRDTQIIRNILSRYPEGIPPRLPQRVKADIAKHHRVSEDSIAMIVSRWRQAFGKPARRDNRR